MHGPMNVKKEYNKTFFLKNTTLFLPVYCTITEQHKETHWSFWYFLFDPGIKTGAKTVLVTVCTHSILRVTAFDSSHDHLHVQYSEIH